MLTQPAFLSDVSGLIGSLETSVTSVKSEMTQTGVVCVTGVDCLLLVAAKASIITIIIIIIILIVIGKGQLRSYLIKKVAAPGLENRD
jgi:hypothetical protein